MPPSQARMSRSSTRGPQRRRAPPKRARSPQARRASYGAPCRFPGGRHWRNRGLAPRAGSAKSVRRRTGRSDGRARPSASDHGGDVASGRSSRWQWPWARTATVIASEAKQSSEARLDCFVTAVLAKTASMFQPADLSPIADELRATAPCAPAAGGAAPAMSRQQDPDWWNAPVPAFGDRDAWLGDRRPRARQVRRQSHRPAIHRRLCRLAALRDPAEIRPRRGRVTRADRRTGCGSRAASSSTRSNACRPPTSPAERDRHLPALFRPSLAVLPNVRVVIALGQIAHAAAARALGQSPTKVKFEHAEHEAPDGRILLEATIVRATTRTPAVALRSLNGCSSGSLQVREVA